MTKRADFYLIAEESATDQWRFACRLLEKAFEQKTNVYVHLSDLNAARQFDKLLWTFRDTSFIPHHLVNESETEPAAIQIGYQDEPPTSFNVLLNLTEQVPDFSNKIERIIEVIPQSTTGKNSARKRYKVYQTQERDIQTHDLRN